MRLGTDVEAAAAVGALLRQAGDLLGDPARPPGWGSDDPALRRGGRAAGHAGRGADHGAPAELIARTVAEFIRD